VININKSNISTLIPFIIIGALLFGFEYYRSFGFTYPELMEPPRRNFDTLQELTKAAKGKYLMPSYIPGELDPEVYSNVEQYYTMICQHGSSNASGVIIEIGKPKGWRDRLTGKDIISFTMRVDDNTSLDVTNKHLEEIYYNEVVYVNGEGSGYFDNLVQSTEIDGHKAFVAGMHFLGTSTNGDRRYTIRICYAWPADENIIDIRDLAKNELIKIAESMIAQGLRSR